MAEFRVLGPVEVLGGAGPLDVGTVKQRTVLASLLIEAGRLVSVDALIYRVWDDAPPDTARATLQSHISRIRRLLAGCGPGPDATLRSHPGGYLLAVAPTQVDLHRARLLVAAADRAGPDDRRRARLLAEALDLWRGDPLTGLPGAWLARMRGTLRRQRLDVLAGWATAALRLGRSAAVIDTLRPLVADAPVTESLATALLHALVADGRDAEALNLYDVTRRRLTDELGADPGAELRAAYQALLRGAPAGTDPRPVPRCPPALLATTLPRFAGRTEHLMWLDRSLEAGANTVSLVTGPAGVGKTALAVHWAHRVAHRFPDGQLHADLRGYAADVPATVRGILAKFLEALGVAPGQVPTSEAGRVGLYRSLLAGRRMLIVLDNAHDAGQVRPLLPGSPACVVVVTSRDQLPGLVAAEGATPLDLGRRSPDGAGELLSRRPGRARATAGPDAVRQIVDSRDGPPPELSVVAARAGARHPAVAWRAGGHGPGVGGDG